MGLSPETQTGWFKTLMYRLWHREIHDELLPTVAPQIWHSERAEDRQRQLRQIEAEQQDVASRLQILDIETKARTRGLH